MTTDSGQPHEIISVGIVVIQEGMPQQSIKSVFKIRTIPKFAFFHIINNLSEINIFIYGLEYSCSVLVNRFHKV